MLAIWLGIKAGSLTARLIGFMTALILKILIGTAFFFASYSVIGFIGEAFDQENAAWGSILVKIASFFVAVLCIWARTLRRSLGRGFFVFGLYILASGYYLSPIGTGWGSTSEILFRLGAGSFFVFIGLAISFEILGRAQKRLS